jgi:predicted transcriptional regulator
MPRESVKNRKVKKWKASSPTIRKSILAFLFQDHCRPKGFNEIRQYVSERKICSGITLSIYLKELEKYQILRRVKVGKRKKYAVRMTRKELALIRESIKTERESCFDMRMLRKETDRMIRKTEKMTLSKEDACNLLEHALKWFTHLQFQIFDMFLKSGIPVEEFLSSEWWHTLVGTIFDLEIQLLSVFHKKYPEQTLKVLEKLRNKPQR